MEPAVYRNDGAPWRRADGTRVRRGSEFVPLSEDEIKRRGYKVSFVRALTPGEQEPIPDGVSLEDYHVGGGWYLIHGEKVQGRSKAWERLNAQD